MVSANHASSSWSQDRIPYEQSVFVLDQAICARQNQRGLVRQIWVFFLLMCETAGWLRSTKWNASLILTCGLRGVVVLCTVICWNNPHSCKDTKMATPREFCRGMSRPVNWYRNQDVTNLRAYEQAIWARLCGWSLVFLCVCSERYLCIYLFSLELWNWVSTIFNIPFEYDVI